MNPVSTAAEPAPGDPYALAGTLREGGFFFSSPSSLLSAPRTTVAALSLETSRDHDQAIRALCAAARARGAEGIVFGLVPFDAARPALFHAPATERHSPGAPDVPDADADIPTLPTCIELPDRSGYTEAVRSALRRIADGALHKVVLARTLALTLPSPPDYAALLRSLMQANRTAYLYAIPAALPDDSGTPLPMLVGASPELLVRLSHGTITVNPLAGSIPRRSDPGDDARAAEGLRRSDKDLREHAIVVDDIRRRLAPLCTQLDVPLRPDVIGTDQLWHLSTLIRGRLRDPAMGALQVALALHPTPAICGDPAPLAFQAIQELEPFARGFFSGLVGWQDAAGNGEWAIALRCALCHGSDLRLYAGAGIVTGSDPTSEYLETGAKLQTLLSAVARSQSPSTCQGLEYP